MIPRAVGAGNARAGRPGRRQRPAVAPQFPLCQMPPQIGEHRPGAERRNQLPQKIGAVRPRQRDHPIAVFPEQPVIQHRRGSPSHFMGQRDHLADIGIAQPGLGQEGDRFGLPFERDGQRRAVNCADAGGIAGLGELQRAAQVGAVGQPQRGVAQRGGPGNDLGDGGGAAPEGVPGTASEFDVIGRHGINRRRRGNGPAKKA